MTKKIFQGFLAIIALTIALMYSFGYSYLFRGIRETYLRGKTGSSIDDGPYFPYNIIAKGDPKPWIKDSLYNRKLLPK